MTYVVVPNVLELRDQLNARFPKREKGAEGTIGDTAHQVSASSHNPDLTGKPEYRDGDAVDEVRAGDFDRDLNDPSATMEDVVQYLVKLARAGDLWWARYFIYNKRIWHRRDGFVTREYTGSDPHTSHLHYTSDFTQEADTVSGTNWRLDMVGLPVVPPTLPPASPILSHRVLKRGMSGDDVGHVQTYLRYTYPAYRNYVLWMPGKLLVVDNDFGGQTEAWVKEFQRRVGLVKDGVVGPKTLGAMRARGYDY